jgi:type I restriction enzyme S subunit
MKAKFKDTEIGRIPEDWGISEVGEIIKHRKGYAFKFKWFQKSGRRIIKVSDFTLDSINISNSLFIEEKKAKEFKDFEIYEGDIIIATVGSWPNNPASIVGKVIRVPKGADGSLMNQNAVILRTKNDKKVNQEFLYYRLRNKDYSHHLISGAQGSANQASITLRDIFSFEIGNPSLEEQTAIAKILSDLDSKIELLQKQNKTLEAIAQAIFKHLFVDFEFPNEEGKPYKSSGGEMILNEELGKEIPKGWEVGKLGDITEMSIGRTPPRKEKEWFSINQNDIKWISIKDLGYSGVYIIDTSEYLTKDAVEKFRIPIIPKNTVVLSFKLTIGRVAITTEDMLSNEAIAHIKLLSALNINTEYIYLYLKNFDYNKLGSTSSIATAVTKLMSGEIRVLNNQKIKEAV